MSEALREPTGIDRVEVALAELPQVTCPLRHWFPPGMYVREITMPAGTIVTSRTHKHEHHFFITKGIVSVLSETERFTYEAPFHGITPAGTKRMLVTHTDTVWTTIHANPNNLTDPDLIVEELTEFDNPLIDDKAADVVNTWKTTVSPSLVETPLLGT